MKPVAESKDCAACARTFRTKANERYCFSCRKNIKFQMVRSGYLQYVPPSNHEPVDRNNSDEDNPSIENAVRTLEGD